MIESQGTPPSQRADDKKEWRTNVVGAHYYWNGDDLFFAQSDTDPEQPVFAKIADYDYRASRRLGDSESCDFEHWFKLASVVGTIVSFEHETGVICGVPSSDWRFRSLDMRRPGDFAYPLSNESNDLQSLNESKNKMLDLTDLFSEEVILKGLLENRRISDEISKAVFEKKMAAVPKSLREFRKLYAELDLERLASSPFLAADFLSRFAFHHVEGDRVAVWISLSTSGSKRANVQEHVEILLPIPERLEHLLILAESKQGGFLMKDVANTVGTSSAEFVFDAGSK